MTVTTQLLRAHNACRTEIEIFEAEWPDGCELSQDTWDRAKQIGLNVSWCEILLSGPARAEYKAVRDPALAEYNAVRAPARAKYVAVRAPARAKYDAVCAQALLAALMSMEENANGFDLRY